MWIELHDTAREHPKLLKLARDLSIKPVVALGHLTSLWSWVLRMSPDGCLDSFDDADIEIGAQWEGEPGAFVAAAINRHLIDADATGSRHIHNWTRYAAYLEAAARARASRERKRAQACGTVRDGAEQNVTVTHSAGTRPTRPDPPDPPDQTDPRSASVVIPAAAHSVPGSKAPASAAELHKAAMLERPQVVGPEGGGSTGGEPPPFGVPTTAPGTAASRAEKVDQVYQHYRAHHPRSAPRLDPNSKAYRNIISRLDEGSTVADLIEAIDGCHKTPWNLGLETGKQFLDLELITRDADHVRRFAENNQNPPKAPQSPGPRTSWRQSATFAGGEVDLGSVRATPPKGTNTTGEQS